MAQRRRLPLPPPAFLSREDEDPEIPDPPAIPSDSHEQRQRQLAEMEAAGWPSVSEVAAQTGIPETTLRRWCATGKLEAVTVDRAYRIDPAAAVRLAVQEERLNVVASEGALATTAPAYLAPTSPGASPPQGDGGKASTALIASVAELLVSTNGRLRSDQQHAEALVTMMLSLVPKTSAAFERQIDGLLRSNAALQDECEKLRSQVRELFASQKDGILEERKIEVKKTAIEGGIDLAKSLAPQVLAMVAAKYQPGDPTACDKGIATLLQGISPEQAARLHASGLVTETQGMEALSFRNAPPAPGALTRWMQSFSGDQLARILAADVLTKDQKAVFAAAHDAASKTAIGPSSSTPAPAPAPAPAPSSSTPAPGAVQVPDTHRILTLGEAEALRGLVAALLAVADDEIICKGESTSVLELVGGRMAPEHRKALKSVEWARTKIAVGGA